MATIRYAEPTPMLEMNMTPLIDVLLVLIIMFIITVPMQTHAVKIDLPSGPPRIVPDPVKNRIVVTQGGAILWNGEPVSKPELGALLVTTQRMAPVPELHLQPEAGARYALVDELLAITKRAEVEKMGFVGNDAYRTAF
ncbi:MAG: biopolymer transporter ExbD [Pseudomonadota bacterium]|nr:biopolymer transporter ExbD [Pseudomonadota bacterium]